MEITERGADVAVTWRETGLNPQDNAEDAEARGDEAGEGFGSRLLRTAVEGQLTGKFTRRITEDSLEVELLLPCEKLEA